MQIRYYPGLGMTEAIDRATSGCGAPKNAMANVHQRHGLLARMPSRQSVREIRHKSRPSVLQDNGPRTYRERYKGKNTRSMVNRTFNDLQAGI